MKLELKHLAPYLPYGLKVLVHGDFEMTMTYKRHIAPYDTESISVEGVLEDGYVRPVLRPLSDLTKEIEHNGEKFVPILELYKLKTQAMDGEIYDSYIENDTAVLRFKGIQFNEIQFRKYFEIDLEPNEVMFSIATERWVDDKLEEESISLCGNEMQMFEKLHQWHFDIYGLIDAGLAIDINTIK